MIEKHFPACLAAALLALAWGLPASAQVGQHNSGSPAGPDDDLGTLPSTNNGPKPPSVNDDDLGTLPVSKGDDSDPTLTFSGPVTLVSGLLDGASGSGAVGYIPGPEPGTVTAYVIGDLKIPLYADDPRLGLVHIELRTGGLPSLGELSAGGQSTGAFHLAPGTRMGLPVSALFELPQLSALRSIRFDLLTASREHFRLGMRAQGSLLILEQRSF